MKKMISMKIASCGIAKRVFSLITIAGLAALFATASVDAAVIYVDSGAGGANNGSSWPNAFTDLQEALGLAVGGDEIWVAAGTYKPTAGSDRTISFVLVDGVGLYGGFAGGETERDQRDWETNTVTLSGDIEGDNSYHVVRCEADTGSTVLDGFTISGGRAYGDYPDGRGGGMYTTADSNIEVTNCTFSGNSGYHGGGMYNTGRATLTNCTFNHNFAQIRGGGMFIGGSATLTNCTFSGNHPTGMFIGGSPTLTNCTFSNNNTHGMYNIGSPTLTNCTFSGNRTLTSRGGGMYNTGSPILTNCTFSNNTAVNGGGMYNTGSPTLINCTFSGNSARTRGGGMYTYGSPTLTNCTFSGNSTRRYDGGIYNAGSLTIKNTIIADNDEKDLHNTATVDSSYNIVETYAGFTPDPTDITGDQPDLNIGPLADNGGPTLTRALLEGSVAIDAGTASGAPATDQRGLFRYASPDIGAYEYPACIYVDSVAEGANNGSSWTDAFTDLQDALALAASGNADIWVAAGTYKPTTVADRKISFVLVDGVRLYGGFAGGETARDQRDWETNPTILSGDIGAGGDDSDNSFHVVRCGEVTGRTVLDGFTICRGNANGYSDTNSNGGGMHTTADSNLEVTNCAFSGNFAEKYGGGMYNNFGSTVTNCTFDENSANGGGGMYGDGSATLTDCTFSGNSAEEYGGGMYNNSGSTAINCTFDENSANGGGGMYSGGSAALTNCTFSGNSAEEYGGGLHMDANDTVTVTNCTFIDNGATSGGDGISSMEGVLTLKNTILADNGAQDLYNTATINSSFNIVETYTGFAPDPTDITGDQPDLEIGPLGDNGGNTWTRALPPGSVAIDAGTDSGAPATDQRGVFRDASPDIGAYEYHRTVIYVDSGAGGANDGTSWKDAFTDLQGALGFALSGDEIWVAAGTYKPTSGADRTISFVLVDGVGLYGGFSGSETARDQRDWETNTVILSGDIDGGTDESYHVVKCGAATGSTVLDGFTISGGSADGGGPEDRGAGMYNTGSPTVTNCIFSDNDSEYGGGMYNDAGSPALTNCAFSGNESEYGGGMHNDSGSPALTNCTFGNNSASWSGGGMYNDSGSPAATDCTFGNNSSSESGGGIHNDSGSPTVTNCAFSDNESEYGGGMHNESGSPEVTDCTFSSNSAGSGGGIANYDGNPAVTHCTFSGNSAGSGGGIANYDGNPAVTHCTFNGNSGDRGGGMYNYSTSPAVTNCTYSGNTAILGGGMYNSGSSALTNCTFSGNTASIGGGMYNGGSPAVINCTFIGNSATGDGDGIFNRGSAVLTINNTILADNGAEDLYNSATVDSSCNIVETYTGFTPDPTDITGDQPDLNIGPLADNGGPTSTCALLEGSVAIDAGTASMAPATDQRGVPRDASPDIGAYEYYVAPPAFTKSFAPDEVAVNGVSTLTFTIDNTFSAQAADELDFTDNLPSGMAVAAPPGASTTCTGGTIAASAGAGAVSYYGGSVSAGTSCTVQIDVTATSSGVYDNTSGPLTSSLGDSGTASDTLTIPILLFSKSFAPNPIAADAVSRLTFTIDNTASSLDAESLDFTDNLPAGVTVADTPNAFTTCAGGAITADAGESVISYTGGTATAGSSCTVRIDVTATSSGVYDNTSGALTSSLGDSGAASDTLAVSPPPVLSKSFTPDAVDPGRVTTVVLTVDNTANGVAASDLSIRDDLPTHMLVADPSNAATTCEGGTIAAAPGASQILYEGGTVSAGAACVVQVDVVVQGNVGFITNEATMSSSSGTSAGASNTLHVNPAIPTLGQWGQILLAALLALLAFGTIRSRGKKMRAK